MHKESDDQDCLWGVYAVLDCFPALSPHIEIKALGKLKQLAYEHFVASLSQTLTCV
jgi:hypothetical protein